MKRVSVSLSVLLVCGVFVSQSLAHYLWVTIDGKTGDHGTTNVYFEGGPGPGDGQYLDPFIEEGTTWIRTLDAPKAAELEMEIVKQPNKRWLSAALPAAGPRSIDSYGKWGVYHYANIKKEVLLHYYARNLEVTKQADLKKLARSEQMKLDLVLTTDGDDVEATLLWEGKPAAGCTVQIRGAQNFSESLKTDDAGKIRLTPKANGPYRFHAIFEQAEGGKDGGKPYDLIRHHSTLLINLPLSG